jgi:hypothetical protein
LALVLWFLKVKNTQENQIMANHGDGSVLKPKFNHGISKSDTSRLEIHRCEALRQSRLPTINRLEDIGAFDVESKLERLQGMKR